MNTTNETSALDQAQLAAIKAPDQAPVQAKLVPLATELATFKIDSADAYRRAAELLKAYVQGRKTTRAMFDDATEKANAAHKALTKLRGEAEKPWSDGEDKLRKLMSEWDQAERRRMEEERKAQEAAAKKRAEEERLEQAIEKEEEGDKAGAAALLDAPVPAPYVPPPAPPPKIAGISNRQAWDFEIIDATKLRADLLLPNLVEIRKLVNAMGDKAAAYCGEGSIKVTSKTITSVR